MAQPSSLLLSGQAEEHRGIGQTESLRKNDLVEHVLSEAAGGLTAMRQTLLRLWREEEGQDLTEYALLLVLIALAAIASMNSLANAITTVFSTAASNLSAS